MADDLSSLRTNVLFSRVYSEIRELAAKKLAFERPDHTLQATALVNEVYLRLSRQDPCSPWKSKRHFFSAAAESMRRILIEHARAKRRQKRGGEAFHTEFRESRIAVPRADEDLLVVNEALDKLEKADEPAAQLVKLRFFVGLTIHEAADAMEISVRSANRIWTFARTWLHREINDTV